MALLLRSHGLNKFMIFTSSDSIVHVFQSCIGTQQWYVNKISPVSYLMFFFHGTAVRDGQTWQSIAIATLWYNLHLSIHSGMGWTVGTGCCKWDTLVWSQSVHCLPWYIGMGWTVDTNGTLWYSPRPSIQSWDGIDSIANGTLWYDSSPSISSNGEIGWDRQYRKWDTLVWFQSIYFVPWWNGMGWTVGTQMGHFSTIPDHPLGFPMYYWTSVGNPGHVCQLFACYAFQSGLSAFKSYYWKLLLCPLSTRSTVPCQCHVASQWAKYELYLWYETLGSYRYWPVVPQTLVPCIVYKAGFLLSCHPLFIHYFLPMPRCNTTTAPVKIISLK